jgi:hypothetical protein
MKIFAPIVLVLALCTPPLARAALFEVTGNLTCTDPGDSAKLLNEKLSAPLMIQAALGGGDGKLYALVYDGNFQFEIVQRCDGAPVRSFAGDGGKGTSFQSPAPPGDTRKYAAAVNAPLANWQGGVDVHGTMICAFKGKSQNGSDEFLTAAGNCKFTADISFRGVCSFGGKLGKPFQTGGPCPQ